MKQSILSSVVKIDVTQSIVESIKNSFVQGQDDQECSVVEPIKVVIEEEKSDSFVEFGASESDIVR